MENKDYSVLILGNFENVYIIQFVKHLKALNPNAHLFFWGYTRSKNDDDRSFVDCYDEYYLFDINHNPNSSIIDKIQSIIQLRKHFKKFVTNRKFDFINVHYIKPEYFFLVDYLKRHASKLILTPWGSDVYGAKGGYKRFVQGCFSSADFITGSDDRFTTDFKQMFNVPDKKIVKCDLGIEPIEYIIEHKTITNTNEAKRQLGLNDHYIITCGYNATSGQQHLAMIEQINIVKDRLPKNLLVLFPLTYNKKADYIQKIKEKVKQCGLNAIYFEDFLDLPRLFLLRQATDIFIHIQISDATSASLNEYLLCEKKVINGAWLKYPELIKNGVTPYFEVDCLENLGKRIVDVYHAEPIKLEKELVDDFEKKQWKVTIKDWDALFSGHPQPINF